MPLKGKKILLAVTGSIAAYKAAYLCRSFIKNGADVRVLMTQTAAKFISPLSFSTLSKNQVYTDVIDDDAWNNHVEMGLWADLMLVAPATATTLSKMAAANCDNIVTAVYLSAKCPVFIAPAMDRDMWQHPANQANIEKLKSYGNTIIDVEEGDLASGLTGKGRMAEPDHILEQISFFLTGNKALHKKKILITAGPTIEDIDPVRYISNRSTGRMGICLAEVCAQNGAEVHLVLGPSVLRTDLPGITILRVRSAAEMYEKAKELHKDCDIAIFSAAVADYRPSSESLEKIKKSNALLMSLERTRDIAMELGKLKNKNQIHVGFALETEHEEANARGKLEKKNFDMIILNSLNDPGAGFGNNTNKVTVYNKNGEKTSFGLKSKKEVANDIVNTLIELYLKS